MATQEHQPSEDRMREKSLEVAHTVGKDVKPYELLLIKCKDDWIHHLAQALAFSFLTTLASIATLLSIFALFLRNLDTQSQRMLTRGVASIFPAPLSAPIGEVFSKAYDTFSHTSGIGVFFTLLVAILFGQMLFSLMESCFDVIYHLPPRPFLRRHLVAILMLLLFFALTPIIVLVSAGPAFLLTLLHIVPPGDISDSNVIVRLASIAGSFILSLILFQAFYVLIPHRHVKFQTVGRHINNSWRGALVATVVLQLGLQLFPLYVTSFLNGYIGQVGFVLITLLYFYLFALILLLGAEVNAFFAEGIRVPKSDLITEASQGAFE